MPEEDRVHPVLERALVRKMNAAAGPLTLSTSASVPTARVEATCGCSPSTTSLGQFLRLVMRSAPALERSFCATASTCAKRTTRPPSLPRGEASKAGSESQARDPPCKAQTRSPAAPADPGAAYGPSGSAARPASALLAWRAMRMPLSNSSGSAGRATETTDEMHAREPGPSYAPFRP